MKETVLLRTLFALVSVYASQSEDFTSNLIL